MSHCTTCPSTYSRYPSVSCSSSFDELVDIAKANANINCAIANELGSTYTGTINIVLVDAAPFNLLANEYRSIKISNIGSINGTINGATIPAGDVIEFSFPDNVNTPSLSIMGSAGPDEMRVEYTHYDLLKPVTQLCFCKK